MIESLRRLVSLAVITAGLASCAPGLLYTDITRPECTDMRSTQLGNHVARAGTYRVEVPTTRIDLTAEWNSRALGDIARRAELQEFYTCDERLVSAVLGLFQKREIVLYGSTGPTSQQPGL